MLVNNLEVRFDIRHLCRIVVDNAGLEILRVEVLSLDCHIDNFDALTRIRIDRTDGILVENVIKSLDTNQN